MRGSYAPQEAVNVALSQIDAKIANGLSPVQAIGDVAAEANVSYEKLEHFYIERGREGDKTGA